MVDNIFKLDLPDDVRYIIEKLEINGYAAYAVGGCVRDAVLGKKPNDWDICTAASPEDTKEIFKDKNLVLAGLKHGTVGIIISGQVYETTTFRVEGEYKDHRRPESVVFVDNVEGDLSRRDFTVNAMAYSDKRGIIDLFGGIEDLKNGIIRCVGDAEQRFLEDALRILRALRFAARFGFKVEEKTKAAAFKLKDLLNSISKERKTSELKGILCAADPGAIIAEFSPVFSTVLQTDENELTKRSRIIAKMPVNFALRLGALVREVNILSDMKLSNAELALAVETARSIGTDPPTSVGEMCRMVMRLGKNAPLILEAMGTVKDITAAKQFLDEIYTENRCCSLKDLNIKGKDLIAVGFKGEQIGIALEKLLYEVMDGATKNDKNELIRRALSIKEEE